MTDLTPFYKIGDKLINLDNVSSIGFIPAKNRLVYNLNHSIETFERATSATIMIADYKYHNFSTEAEYLAESKQIRDHSLLFGFIHSSSDFHHLVNPINISYISFDSDNKRIIFNLCTPVTKRKYNQSNELVGESMLTNDFVFWTYQTQEEYEANVKYVEKELAND